MVFKKLLLHHVDIFYKLHYLFGTFKMIWLVAPNLGLCPQIWVFNAFRCFWVIILKIWGF